MTELLTTVAIIFIVAGPFVLVANRFNIPAVPLLIVAGLVVGNFIDEASTIEIARYGIALLVFVFGARIEFDAVRVVLGDSEIVAIGQILSIGAIGTGAGVLLGLPVDQAVLLGIAAALSSTIVGTAYLQSSIRKNLVRGRLAESIQYVQDIVAIGILLILGAEVLAIDPIATELGYGIILGATALIVYRYGFPLLERAAGHSDEPLLVGSIALLVAFLGMAEFLGVSIVIGAFAAGLAVHHDPAKHLGLFNGIESVKDFFVAIFFVTVGALVSFPGIEVLLFAILLGVLTAIVKPIITFMLLIYQGYEARSSTLTSLNLDQMSEFSLIIAIEALAIGILVQATFDAIILAAAATMITSGVTNAYNEEIYQFLSKHSRLRIHHQKIDERSHVTDDLDDHIIVIGYGRQGRKLLHILSDLDCEYVVMENDPARLPDLERDCDSYVFGDAMEPYAWEKASLDSSRLVISTVESRPVSNHVLGMANDLDVIVRASTSTLAVQYLEAGARYAYVDDSLAANQLIEYITAIETGQMSVTELREKYMEELSNGQRGQSSIPAALRVSD